MNRILILFLCMCATLQTNAQLCSPLPDATVNLFCGQSCFNYQTAIFQPRTTEDYTVSTIPFNFVPFTASGTALNTIYVDDKFSPAIEMPFSFCFYGQTYGSCVIGSNGLLTFDLSTANQSNAWPLTVSSVAQPIPYAGGTQNVGSPAYYPKASVMGPYHDIDPSVLSASPNRRIEWLVAGVAPCRMFIVNYYQIPMFSGSCNSQLATHQIILYESTGIIDVNIVNKPVCSSWNSGLAILGLQNFARDKAIAAPGKNATVWTSTNESYRFTGSGAGTLFVKAELIKGTAVVALADTVSNANGTLQLNFPQVCQVEDSVTYKMRVTYRNCNLQFPSTIISESNVKVRKTAASNLTAALAATNASCTNPNGGTLVVTPGSGIAPYQYSLNGGPFQPSNTFTGLATGTSYQVRIRDAAGCEITRTGAVGFNNDITLQSRPDTSFCNGISVRMNTTSNASQFSWTPANSLSSGTIKEPVAAPSTTTTYIVTATLNGCVKTDTVTLTVLPAPTVNAGVDRTIVEGEDVQLDGITSLPINTFNWSPATTLNNANVLNPIARPLVTTTYTLSATNNFGCPAQDNVVITVIPYCVRPIRAFTPNGDGMHDLWVVTTGACVNKIIARVYNRYGGLMYASDNYKNDWNGMYNNKPVPDATYYYTLDITLISGRRVLLKGDVTILR
jgi:gliding motility-associated-like protein